MNKTQKILLVVILIAILILIAVWASYFFSKKAADGILTAQNAKPEEPKLDDIRAFDLGDFLANTADKRFHVVKAKITVEYLGGEFFEKLLVVRKPEMKDVIQRILMKKNKEELHADFIDTYLHKEILAQLNVSMGTEGQKARVYKVLIPEFFIQ